MAGMKGFYTALAGVAVVGVVALFWTSNRRAAVVPVGPIPQAAIDAAREFGGYAVGNQDAKVEIVEYADFQCPACRQHWVLTIQDIKQRLVPTGQVRFVFRDFPLDMHGKARPAHHAAACADEQDLFWEMHDLLFIKQNEWVSDPGSPETLFRRYANEIGANEEQYNQCMAEGRYRARIQASYDGGVAMRVGSTPSIIIGNTLYEPMHYDQLKAIVDSLLALPETD